MQLISLYLFHFIFFIETGLTVFLPKYFDEIGLSVSQIGLLNSIPALVGLAFTPLFGIISDRISKRRYLVLALVLLMSGVCFVVPSCVKTGSFPLLLAAICVYTIFSGNILSPVTTLSIEYTSQIGRSYGPIRMLGTIGYQLGTVLVAIILSDKLDNLYPLMGAFLLVSCTTIFIMPNSEGKQYKRAKVPLTDLFKDRHVVMLYVIVLFATITSQFYMSFYTKHLGDLGMSNAQVSVITLISVLPEVPFLVLAKRLEKMTNFWNWLLIGIFLTALRWLGLAMSDSFVLNLIFQIPCVAVMACFEYFPAIYLSRRVPEKLRGSAQSILTLTTFGIGKVLGSLIGGYICEVVSIPTVMLFNGIALLIGVVIFYKPTRKLIAAEEKKTC